MKLVNVINACSVLMFVALASGCGESGDSSNGGGGATQTGAKEAYQEGSGNCSEQFVSDYNTVTDSMKYARTMSDVDKAQSLVSDLASKYRDVNCQAKSLDDRHLDGTPITIDVNSKVAEWNSLIARARGEGAGPSGGSPQTDPSTPISPIPASPENHDPVVLDKTGTFTFEVFDADTLNRIVDGGWSLVIQDGAIVALGSNDHSKPFCLISTGNNVPYQKGQRISLQITPSPERLSASDPSLQDGLVITCAHRKEATWTLDELQHILGGVIRITN